MHYLNREDAAAKLLPFLGMYKDEEVVILAVPRGGVPIAFPIAKKYNFPLELLMTKKVGHPSNPEFAIGAVSLEDYIVDERQNVSPAYLKEEIARIRKNLEDRYFYFMGAHKPISLENKTLIIIDDGIATGNTILSAIKMLRRHKPQKIVVAVPVAPPDVVQKIKKEVDDFICPYTPYNFYSVGYHYIDFSEVTDQEVIRFLQEINENKKAA